MKLLVSGFILIISILALLYTLAKNTNYRLRNEGLIQAFGVVNMPYFKLYVGITWTAILWSGLYFVIELFNKWLNTP